MKSFIAYSLSLIIVIILGCVSYKPAVVTDFTNFIPKDFNQNNDTLLFLNSNLFQAPMYRNKLKKSYTGNYVVIPRIKNESLEHCRFYMYEDVNEKTTNTIYNGDQSKNTSRSSYSNAGYTIVDRKTGKEYHNTTIYSKINFANYLRALDAARQSK